MAAHVPTIRKSRGDIPWRKIGLGTFGLGVACVGCCLAPLAGVFLAASGGAGFLGYLSSRPMLFGILGGILAISAYGTYLIRRSRRTACCPGGSTECEDNTCSVRNPEADAGAHSG